MANLPARQSKPTPAQMGRNSSSSGGTRPTINVTYNINGGGGQNGTGGSAAGPVRRGGQWVRNTLATEPRQVPLPNGVPRFLGNNKVVGYAWLGSMILVGFDEWKNNSIMPRPARLWSTSLVYGVLALVGMVDMLVPIANALAIGYFIMLLWQFFNGQGQFSGEATVGSSTSPGAQAVNRPTRPSSEGG